MIDADDNSTQWLREMLSTIRSRWPIIVGTAAVFFLMATYYLHTTPYSYTAALRVSSAQASTARPGLGSLGGLAAIAGVGGGVAGESATPFKLYVEGLTSREIATRLSRNPELMRVIFKSEWDSGTGRWREPRGPLRSIKEGVFNVLGIPIYAWEPPGPARMQEFLGNNILVDQNVKTPLVTILFDWTDPVFAVKFLTALHEADDNFVREQARARTESNVAYLRSKVETTSLAEYRSVLFNAIADQAQQMMLVNASAPYAAEPFGPATSSLRPTKPRPIPVLIGTTVAGLIAGTAVAVLLGRRRIRAN
jgi:uncharacterized protein involved in exopolysaccharide biosynthesis